MRKNRRKQPIGKVIILASSIIMLNYLGVSYANWNDSLDVTNSISTGQIKPYFVGEINKVVGNMRSGAPRGKRKDDEDMPLGEITARFINSNTLEIKGWCYPNYNENFFVKVGNGGTMPIIYNGFEAEDDDEMVKQIQYKGSDVKKNDEQVVDRRQEAIEKRDVEDIKIHIEAENNKETELGNKSFTYQLHFEQGLK
ncbi:MAG: hypothetical protein K0S61_4194 [Anaerocolumna sp.]|jgi:hypothetical protein|nr:hypothetical protein [Anaerocolumna sp.]